jgi:hypothetical protein
MEGRGYKMAEYSGFPICTPTSIRERIESRLAEAHRERVARLATAGRPSRRTRLADYLRALAERLEGAAEPAGEPWRRVGPAT